MRFVKKTEEEITKSNLLEKGEYPFEVLDANQMISEAGNDMIKLKLLVWDKNGREHIVFDYLLESMIYKLKHFCDATGLQEKYESETLHDTDCSGKTGIVKLYIQEDKKGTYAPKNSVADYIVSDKLPAASGTKNEEFFSDEIPF